MPRTLTDRSPKATEFRGPADKRDAERCPYPIRAFDPRNEDAILELLRLTVGETAASRKTTSFWRWKHTANPFGPSYAVCAWDDATRAVVGLRTLMWWSFRDRGGSHLRAARAVDTATHPDHQRRGIFSASTRFAIDDLRDRGVPFIFNTPNANSLPGYLKMGWRVVDRWPLYMRPSRWLRTGWKVLARGRAGTAVSDATVPIDTNLMSWAEFRARHDADPARLVLANEVLRRCVGYRTERTLAYLDWRYGAHPDVEYGVHTLIDRGALVGVAIGRPVRGARGLKALAITEILLRTPSRRHAARLLRSLARASDCDYLMAHFAPGTFEHDALILAGFIRAAGRGYTFVARPLNPAPNDPTRPESWDLTLGELEIF